MGKLAPPAWQPITEHTDRATIEARLRRLNAEAMDISRRGYAGTRSTDYETRHATLNLLLFQWQMATGPNCRTCGRTKTYCDAEPRRCCDVCMANGHGDGART